MCVSAVPPVEEQPLGQGWCAMLGMVTALVF